MTVTWRVSCPTLVGRAEELAGLRSAIEATRDTEDTGASRSGGQGRISLLLVTGLAGMGKTRLIGAAASWAAGTGRGVIEGACLPLGQSLPYGPFAEMLGPGLFTGGTQDRLARFRSP